MSEPLCSMVEEGWLWLSVGLFSLIIGSFLNVVVFRLPRMLQSRWRQECQLLLNQAVDPSSKRDFNLAVPGSHCPACQSPIPLRFNIPLLGYLFLKGNCHTCGARISLRYPLLEVLALILALMALRHFGCSAEWVFALFFLWILLVLCFIDMEHQWLPDTLTLPLLWLGLCLSVFNLYVSPEASILGAAIGYLCLWSVFWIFKGLTGRDGMGFGDFKLLAALGAWVGWTGIPWILVIASFSGAAFGIAMVLAGRMGRQATFPFGPFLALGGAIVFLYPDDLALIYEAWLDS